MIEFREISNTNIVEFTIDSSISGAEFDELVAKIEAAIRQHGTLRILEHIRSFGGMPVAKVWDDIKFGFKNMKNFSHAAVVADQKWIELFTRAAKPFVSAEVRYFNETDIEQARECLRSRLAGTTPHAA
jgi:stage II sporulation SpoAA-like protein